VRGGFKYNTNHFPIQNFYLRQVVKDGNELKLVSRGVVFSNHADVYSKECPMKW
jgi:branched-chain amino acid transport system substrate-binding protein